jgi:hypothetical protein
MTLPPINSLPSSDRKRVIVIGWSWILLGSFWLLLFTWTLEGRLLQSPPSGGPFDDVLGVIEPVVFVGTILSGVALLRQWRGSKAAIWIISILWFSFSLYMIWPEIGDPAPHFGILSPRLVGYGPPLVLSLYSPIILRRLSIHRKIKRNDDSEGLNLPP